VARQVGEGDEGGPEGPAAGLGGADDAHERLGDAGAAQQRHAVGVVARQVGQGVEARVHHLGARVAQRTHAHTNTQTQVTNTHMPPPPTPSTA
jgi:hypothetical protein